MNADNPLAHAVDLPFPNGGDQLTSEIHGDGVRLGRTFEAEDNDKPRLLSDMVGQTALRGHLETMIAAAKARGDVLRHLLFTGPPGLGKSVFGEAIAAEMGVDLTITSGAGIDTKQSLVARLCRLRPREVLLIDEIHAVVPRCQDMLSMVMKDFVIRPEVISDLATAPPESPKKVMLPPFTVIGTTTEPDGISTSLLEQFTVEEFDYYDVAALAEYAARQGLVEGIDIPDAVARAVADRGRGSPRRVRQIVRHLRDYAFDRDRALTLEFASEVFRAQGLDSLGFEWQDRSVLSALKSHGRPLGLHSLAAVAGVTPGTVKVVIEPELLRRGLIQRTGQGRVITQAGIDHLAANPEPLD